MCCVNSVKTHNLFPEPFRKRALPKKFDSAIHLTAEFDLAVTKR